MSDRIKSRLQLPCKFASVIVVLSAFSSVSLSTAEPRRCKGPPDNGCPLMDCSSPPASSNFHPDSCFFIGAVLRSIPGNCSEDVTQLGAQNCCIGKLDKDKLGRYRRLTSLHLQCNFISTLPDRAFENNPLLREVDLSMNRIAVVDNGTFEGLAKLEELNLRNNCLTSLPSSTFSSLGKLVQLHLDFNQFEVVQPSWLRSVEYFSIEHNKLVEWPQYCVAPKLKKLMLGHNLLTTWRRTDLIGLECLDLRDNQLTNVDRDAFVGNRALLDIDLSNNRLTKLDPSTFDHLHHLRTLYLNGNQLHTAYKEWFVHVVSNAEPDVSEMTSDNPWSCGCENARMQHYLTAIATCNRPMYKAISITCRRSDNLEEHNLVDIPLRQCQEMPVKNTTCKTVSRFDPIGSQARKMHRIPTLAFLTGAISGVIALCVVLYACLRRRKAKSDEDRSSRPSSFATVSSDGEIENPPEPLVDENGYLVPIGYCVGQEPPPVYTDMMSFPGESRRPIVSANPIPQYQDEDTRLSEKYFNVPPPAHGLEQL